MENQSHEQALRRALLNSDFFHENLLIRWSKRIGFGEKSFLPVAYGSFVSGILLAILFQATFVLQPEPAKNSAAPVVSPRAEQARFVLQDLYQKGQIKLLGEDADGTRIYSLAVNDSTVKIYDKSPYVIDLASTHK